MDNELDTVYVIKYYYNNKFIGYHNSYSDSRGMIWTRLYAGSDLRYVKKFSSIGSANRVINSHYFEESSNLDIFTDNANTLSMTFEDCFISELKNKGFGIERDLITKEVCKLSDIGNNEPDLSELQTINSSFTKYLDDKLENKNKKEEMVNMNSQDMLADMIANENNGHFYYDIHIVEDEETGMGYSVFIETTTHYDEDLDEESILEEAILQDKLDADEAQYCDTIREIDEEEYMQATGEVEKTELEEVKEEIEPVTEDHLVDNEEKLEEAIEAEVYEGKDVLYMLESFTADEGIDEDQSKFLAFCNTELNLDKDLSNVSDWINDANALEVAKAIQQLSSKQVFNLVRACYGDEIADKFDNYVSTIEDTGSLDITEIKEIENEPLTESVEEDIEEVEEINEPAELEDEIIEDDFEELVDVDEEDLEEVKENIEEAIEEVNETEEVTEETIEQVEEANNEIDTLIADEEEAIQAYETYLATAKENLIPALYEVLEKEMQELIDDEKEHIEKLKAIKEAFHFNTVETVEEPTEDVEETEVLEESNDLYKTAKDVIIDITMSCDRIDLLNILKAYATNPEATDIMEYGNKLGCEFTYDEYKQAADELMKEVFGNTMKTESVDGDENCSDDHTKLVMDWKQRVEDAVEAEDLQAIVDEILEYIEPKKDTNFAAEDLYNGMSNVLDDSDAGSKGPVTYVKSVKVNMQNILDDFLNDYKQACEEEE